MTSVLACEQALIFVVIIDVARAAKPRVTNRQAQRAGEGSGTSGTVSFLVPDPSPARCARRFVTRGFAARATSIITTKMRACSQATSVRNISAIHTGQNAIISSSMSYLLGCNYCDAALYLVPGQQLIYDWKRSIEPHGNRKFINDL